MNKTHTKRGMQLIQLIEKRKQQLLRAAAAVSASTSASASAKAASSNATSVSAAGSGGAAAASYSNGTHKCHLNENSDECAVSSGGEIEVNKQGKRPSSLKRVAAIRDKMRVDESESDLRTPHIDVNETSHVASAGVAAIKYKITDEMKCDCSRASLQSTVLTALDNECDEKCTRGRDKRRDKRSLQSGKLKRDKSKSSLVNEDDDDIFTTASHIIIRDSSSESEDEEIRKIMCAKKLTSNGESIYRKMSTKQCESMSDDEDDDDDDTTLPISLDRSESTAYKQQDTTIVYFTHRRDEMHSSLSPQLNLPSSDVSCNSPVSTSTPPPPTCHNKQDN